MAQAEINKWTCCRPLVMNSLREIFWVSVTYSFKLHAIHIPGHLNEIPDTIYRNCMNLARSSIVSPFYIVGIMVNYDLDVVITHVTLCIALCIASASKGTLTAE